MATRCLNRPALAGLMPATALPGPGRPVRVCSPCPHLPHPTRSGWGPPYPGGAGKELLLKNKVQLFFCVCVFHKKENSSLFTFTSSSKVRDMATER